MPFSSLVRSSKFLFDWNALDGLDLQGRLVARTSQIGTFSRGGTAGTASSVDVNGRVFVPGSSTPRFYHQYDSTTGTYTPRGVVLTGSRKNLVLYPEDLTNGWTLGGAGAVAAAYASAAGLSFSRVSGIDDTTYVRRAVTLTADGTKSFAIDVRTDGVAGYGVATLFDSTAVVKRGRVKYTVASDGSVTFTALSGTLLGTERLGNGVYRALMQAPGCVAANANFIYALANGESNTLTSVQIAAVQVEDAAFPSQCIPQTSSALTRSADALTFPVNIEPRAMTVYVDAVSLVSATVGTSFHLWHIGTGSATTPYIKGRIDGATGTLYGIADHGAGALLSSAGTPSYGDRIEQRVVLSATGTVLCASSINGATETVGSASGTGTLASAWSAQTISVGADTAGTQPFFGAVRSLRIAAGAQTLAYMRAA